MSKKYELIETEFVFNMFGVKLFRIRALLDIKLYGVRVGEKGGYLEKEANLKQDGGAWVSGDAQVYGNAQVSGGAVVSGNAQVSGDAQVYGDAQVSGGAWVEKRHQCASISNLQWSFTSLPKGVQVGCHFHSLKEWKANHLRIGQNNGLNEDQARAYYQLMRAVRRIQRLEALKLRGKK